MLVNTNINLNKCIKKTLYNIVLNITIVKHNITRQLFIIISHIKSWLESKSYVIVCYMCKSFINRSNQFLINNISSFFSFNIHLRMCIWCTNVLDVNDDEGKFVDDLAVCCFVLLFLFDISFFLLFKYLLIITWEYMNKKIQHTNYYFIVVKYNESVLCCVILLFIYKRHVYNNLWYKMRYFGGD